MLSGSQEIKALWLMDLCVLWILKDKGIVTDDEIQERLRQTKDALASNLGEGDATQLVEAAMKFVAQKSDTKSADILGFPSNPKS